DPKQPPVGETQFLVEDYVPERLDAEIATDVKTVTASGVPLTLDGRWLYGAPAADLAVEGDITIRTSSAPLPGLEGYRFGLSDEEVSPVRTELPDLARTDANGHATVNIARPNLPRTSKPL